jgi:hypothetical protein
VDLEGLDDLGASLSNTSPYVKLSISLLGEQVIQISAEMLG